MNELAQQILDLQNGDHLCLFYGKDPSEQMPALVPFIQDALVRDERFIYVADDLTVEELTDFLRTSGVEVDREIQKGRLKLWTRGEWRQQGKLSPRRKALQVQQILEQSLAEGFKSTRFAVEMTWTLGPDIDARALERWESTINTIFAPGKPGRIICQYNQSRLSPEAMLAALHTHPRAILGDEIHPNMFYRAPVTAPRRNRGQNSADAPEKLRWMLEQLRTARAAERQREELIRERAMLVESNRSRQQVEEAERQLRRRTLELSSFVETAGIGLHCLGSDGRIEWANAAELQLLGYRSDEYIGRRYIDFHVDREAARRMFERLMKGEVIRGLEAQLRCKDGTIKDVLIDSTVLWEDGRFIHTQCFTRDFTEHKRMVADLRRLHEMNSRLTTARELEPVLSEVLSAALAIHRANRGFLSLAEMGDGELRVRASSGFSEKSLALISAPACSHGPCGAAFHRRQRIIVEDIETAPEFAEYRDTAMLGGFRAVHSSPLITSEGKIIGVVSIHFTERRLQSERESQLMDLFARQAADVIEGLRLREQLERQIAERNRAEEGARRLAAIVASSNDAIIGITLEGIVTSWNGSAERLYGYAADEIIGRNVHCLVPDTMKGEEGRILDRARRGELIEHYETVRQRKDGTLVDISLTLSPIKDAEGRIIGASKIARDISDRKRAEELLRRQHRELAELDAKKNEFLAMLSHELRNPLAAIQNAAELLGEESDESTRHWAISIVRRQVCQLSRMVEDLVDVSRITHGRIELRRDDLDVRPILRRAIDTARPLIEERGHAIDVVAPEETLLVSGDSARLEQLLVNLLTNAAKYTDPGGHIQVMAGRENGHVVLQVKDNGIGIAPDLLPEIFGLFVQDPRGLDRARGGLGIGLALARRLAELHGGTLEATSGGLGCGSTFTLRLPFVALQTRDRLSLLSHGRASASANTEPHRILLVDDNQDSAQSLRRLLERRGHQVWVANDGLAALDAAQQFDPDTFLLDIGLPGIDGYQLAQRLQQQGFESALFVAISGYAQPQDIEHTREAGFQHHLAKPVQIEQVLEVLRTPKPALG